jgi:hypothetical protein
MEILIIIVFLILYGILYYLKKKFIPRIIGTYGEYKVSSKLKRLNRKDYIVLNDILLKKNNSTTQIDHIVVCKSGIFVIETKNYKGWIHGHEKSEYWTQTIYKKKNKLFNPIKQNWIHIYALKNILPEHFNLKYFPIIVFSGSGKLRNIRSSVPVIYKRKILNTIRKTNDQNNLSFEQMKNISEAILEKNITSQKENRQHVKRVTRNVSEKKKKERLKICPKCGNKLINKNGKFGNFYGCINFPKCRYTFNGK